MKFSIVATLVRAFIAWLMILGLATANGVLRESVLVPALGTTPGLMLSGVILSACVLAVALLLMPRLGPVSTRTCLGIGVFWLFGLLSRVAVGRWHETTGQS